MCRRAPVRKGTPTANILCWIFLEASLDEDESARRFNWQEIPGSSSGGVGVRQGGKEATRGCIIKQAADVGSWGSVLLRKSGPRTRVSVDHASAMSQTRGKGAEAFTPSSSQSCLGAVHKRIASLALWPAPRSNTVGSSGENPWAVSQGLDLGSY